MKSQVAGFGGVLVEGEEHRVLTGVAGGDILPLGNPHRTALGGSF